jgi:hypothetical protein
MGSSGGPLPGGAALLAGHDIFIIQRATNAATVTTPTPMVAWIQALLRRTRRCDVGALADVSVGVVAIGDRKSGERSVVASSSSIAAVCAGIGGGRATVPPC